MREWLITPFGRNSNTAFFINIEGNLNGANVYASGLTVRPVFYLESNVIKGLGTGTINDPENKNRLT